jgi:8-oxo-dGTP pyrophosphatase MutT (NUDIX family)
MLGYCHVFAYHPDRLESDRLVVRVDTPEGGWCGTVVRCGLQQTWPGNDLHTDNLRADVMIKHATAGTFVFCRLSGTEWRLGLVKHPRMGVLACPGGHVEEYETPAEAALRETEEETGLAGVRLLGYPAPSVPSDFPSTHTQIPLPWWMTEIEVPADNHLAIPHVHVDHVWVAIAPDPRPARDPEHPFDWYTATDVKRGVPMFEDSRVLAPALFDSIASMDVEVATGIRVLTA